MATSYDIAERIARYAAQFGYDVERHGSASSSSQYVNLAFYQEHDDGSHDYETLKIRVSDHDLPPTYGKMHGYADYEVGSPDSTLEWDDVVEILAKRTSNSLPPAVKAVRTRHANEAEKREKQRQEYASKFAEQNRRWAEGQASVNAEMAARGLNHLSGKARKRARYKIRKQLGL